MFVVYGYWEGREKKGKKGLWDTCRGTYQTNMVAAPPP
jgi:hypothetical protein